MIDQNKQKLKELVQHSYSKEADDELTKILDTESTTTEKIAVLYFLSAFNTPNSLIEGYLSSRLELNNWIIDALYDLKDTPEIDNYRKIAEEWMSEMGFPKKEIRSYIPTLNKEAVKKLIINENFLSKVKKDQKLLIKTAKEIIDSHFQLSPITKEILTLALREDK